MTYTRLLRVACLAPWLLFALVGGCYFNFGPQIRGSGVSKTETRTVADFNEVEVGGAVQLELTVGPATSLEVTTDDNILPLVVTEVVGGRLKISMRDSSSTSLGVKVKATTRTLTALEGNGATHTQLSGIHAKEFRLTLSGASKCTMTGDAERLTVDCSGASGADTTKVAARVVEATASGASTVEVQASEELTADASGASKIRFTGPAKVKANSSGASSIKAK